MSEKRLLLMTPGPTEIPLRVVRAMMRPATYHYDPDFIQAYDETEAMLKQIFQTRSDIVFFPGSGRTGMEAAVLSLIEPGDKVLTVIAGVFSRWFRDIVLRHEGIPVELNFDWRKSIDTDKIEQKLEEEKDIKVITLVHNETSTGAVTPVREVGAIAEKFDKVLIVDAVSSMGGSNVPVDDWNVDVCVTAPQKCLGALIGLSIASVSKHAWEAMEARKKPARSYSFDLLRWRQHWIPKERGGLLLKGRRSFPVLPPTHIVFALNEACKIILEEGVEKRFKRHATASKAMRESLKAMRLELYPDEGIASHTVTAVMPPPNVKDADIRRMLMDRHGIMIAGGMEELSGKTMRIGHMGFTADRSFIERVAIGMEDVLGRLGYEVRIGIGESKVAEVFERG